MTKGLRRRSWSDPGRCWGRSCGPAPPCWSCRWSWRLAEGLGWRPASAARPRPRRRRGPVCPQLGLRLGLPARGDARRAGGPRAARAGASRLGRARLRRWSSSRWDGGPWGCTTRCRRPPRRRWTPATPRWSWCWWRPPRRRPSPPRSCGCSRPVLRRRVVAAALLLAVRRRGRARLAGTRDLAAAPERRLEAAVRAQDDPRGGGRARVARGTCCAQRSRGTSGSGTAASRARPWRGPDAVGPDDRQDALGARPADPRGPA